MLFKLEGNHLLTHDYSLALTITESDVYASLVLISLYVFYLLAAVLPLRTPC